MPYDPLPAYPGWSKVWNVPHAPREYSRWTGAIQGVPTRPNIRMGVRSATPEPTPPPAFAFLLANVKQTPHGGPAAKALIPQLQPPIGVIH